MKGIDLKINKELLLSSSSVESSAPQVLSNVSLKKYIYIYIFNGINFKIKVNIIFSLTSLKLGVTLAELQVVNIYKSGGLLNYFSL